MDRLEQLRLGAADHLGNAINTFITCDDRKVRRSILFDAVDATSDYALARFMQDKRIDEFLHIFRAGLREMQTHTEPPPAESSVDGCPGT